jgi:general secretion pathway protein G
MNRNPLRKCFPRGLPEAGFTLVEMLLVLVILGILAGIIYPNISKHGARTRIVAAQTQIRTFRSALAAFEMDNDHFPEGRGGMLSLVQRPRDARNWRGPYLDGDIPKDPWGHDYLYECPGTHNHDGFDIMSMGPDGLAGTEDDISNWAPAK